MRRAFIAGLRLHALVFVFPPADLGLRLFLADAVAGLDLADQLVAAALDLEQVAVGQLAPLLLDGALGLIPATLDLLPDRVGLALGRGAGLGVYGRRDGHQRDGGEGGENGDRTHGNLLSFGCAYGWNGAARRRLRSEQERLQEERQGHDDQDRGIEIEQLAVERSGELLLMQLIGLGVGDAPAGRVRSALRVQTEHWTPLLIVQSERAPEAAGCTRDATKLWLTAGRPRRAPAAGRSRNKACR